MGNFVQRTAGINGHLRIRKSGQHARTIHDRIKEHGNRTEDYHRGHGNGRFVSLALDDRFCAQHGSRPANGTTGRSNQGRIPVHFQQTSQQNTQEDGLLVTIDLDFFVYDEENDCYYRESESFAERAYSHDFLCTLLAENGFELVTVYGDDSFDPAGETTQRAIYVAKKTGKEN